MGKTYKDGYREGVRMGKYKRDLELLEKIQDPALESYYGINPSLLTSLAGRLREPVVGGLQSGARANARRKAARLQQADPVS